MRRRKLYESARHRRSPERYPRSRGNAAAALDATDVDRLFESLE
jgi:hypothetical protein